MKLMRVGDILLTVLMFVFVLLALIAVVGKVWQLVYGG